MADSQTFECNKANAMFETWAHEQLELGKFKGNTVVVYRSIWQAWTAWLLGRETSWSKVSANDVTDFLDGPAPGQKRHRRPIRANGLANFTRQRYWRVLRGVYSCAKRLDLINDNPVMDVPENLRPTIAARSLLPQVLPPSMLVHLQNPDTIKELIPVLKDTHWWSLRNRAVMSVLTHLGLTTAELGALSAAALRSGTTLWIDKIGDWTQDAIEGVALDETVWLDVASGGPLAARSLVVPMAIVPILHQHLSAHRMLYSQRLTKGWSKGIGNGSLGYEIELQGRLRRAPMFPSRKCIGGDKLNLPGMDEVTVFELVQKVTNSFFASHTGQHLDPRDRGVHMGQGAAIVRNTLIRQWIETFGQEEAVKRAGFESQESLRQHSAFPQEDRQTA